MVTLEMFFALNSTWIRAVEWTSFSKSRQYLTDKWGQPKLGYLAGLPHPFLQPAFLAQLCDARLMHLVSRIYRERFHPLHFNPNYVTPAHQ